MGGNNDKQGDANEFSPAQASTNIINTEASSGKSLVDFANKSFAKRSELQDPYIKQQQSIASGNMGDVTAAMSLPLGTFQQQKAATKEQIMNTMPPGAARDYALAEAERKNTSSTYDFMRAATLQAPKNLAEIGQQEGQFGLAQGGLGFSGLHSALSGANSQLSGKMQADAQQQSSTLGFIGSLAGRLAGMFS